MMSLCLSFKMFDLLFLNTGFVLFFDCQLLPHLNFSEKMSVISAKKRIFINAYNSIKDFPYNKGKDYTTA